MGETSDVGFVGGLSNGRNGVFAMPLHSRFQYNKALADGKKPDPKGFFSANKSYFFFDNPAGAGYRYIVLVKTTPPQLAAFAAAMAEPDKPIVIGRQDSLAHIVLDRPSKTWGAVFFAAAADPALAAPPGSPVTGLLVDGFPVTGVSQPCLLMIQTLAPDKLAISAGDPDLHVEKRVSAPSTLTFTLAGAWKLAAADPQVKATTTGNQTTLRVTCVEGRSFTFELQRQPGG